MLDDVLADHAFGKHHFYRWLSTNKNLQRQLPNTWQSCTLMHVCACRASSLLEASINVQSM